MTAKIWVQVLVESALQPETPLLQAEELKWRLELQSLPAKGEAQGLERAALECDRLASTPNQTELSVALLTDLAARFRSGEVPAIS